MRKGGIVSRLILMARKVVPQKTHTAAQEIHASLRVLDESAAPVTTSAA
jgi:hypothetical protein